MNDIKIEVFIDATHQDNFSLAKQLRELVHDKPNVHVSFRMAFNENPSKAVLNRFKAIKAAGAHGGNSMVWDVILAMKDASSDQLDDLSKLFVILKKVIPHFDRWLLLYHDQAVLDAVYDDMKVASAHHMNQLPALLINDRIVMTDGLNLDVLNHYLGNIEKTSQPSAETNIADNGVVDNTASEKIVSEMKIKETKMNEIKINEIKIKPLPISFDVEDGEANACLLVDGKWKCN